jgi:hypothetical protein
VDFSFTATEAQRVASAVALEAERWNVLLVHDAGPPQWATVGPLKAGCALAGRVVWTLDSDGLRLDPVTALHEIHHVALGAWRDDFADGVIALDAAVARALRLSYAWHFWLQVVVGPHAATQGLHWSALTRAQRSRALAVSREAAFARGVIDARGRCTYKCEQDARSVYDRLAI